MSIGTSVNKQEPLAAGFTAAPMRAENLSEMGLSQPSPMMPGQISFTSEIIRKCIHLASLTIPIAYFYVHREEALLFLVPATLFSIGIDVGRHYIPAIHRMVEQLLGRILRPHERRVGLLSGATYVLISALICVAVFPKLITMTAFSILIVSDSSSAIFGRKFGKHRFIDKSLEGTMAFIVTAWLVILIAPKAGPALIEYFIGAFAAVVGGVAEAASVSLHLDDNFSVPISIGITMWGLYWLISAFDPASYGVLYQTLLHIS